MSSSTSPPHPDPSLTPCMDYDYEHDDASTEEEPDDAIIDPTLRLRTVRAAYGDDYNYPATVAGTAEAESGAPRARMGGTRIKTSRRRLRNYFRPGAGGKHGDREPGVQLPVTSAASALSAGGDASASASTASSESSVEGRKRRTRRRNLFVRLGAVVGLMKNLRM